MHAGANAGAMQYRAERQFRVVAAVCLAHDLRFRPDSMPFRHFVPLALHCPSLSLLHSMYIGGCRFYLRFLLSCSHRISPRARAIILLTMRMCVFVRANSAPFCCHQKAGLGEKTERRNVWRSIWMHLNAFRMRA